MIDATIKVKEKKNSYSLKAKISKGEIENYLTTPEGIAELKKDVLDLMAHEIDNFILEAVEEFNGSETAEEVSSVLGNVQVIIEEGEYKLDDETEEEETEVEEEASGEEN